MPGATFDMWTSGDMAGEIKRPLAYTATEDDATRVKIFLQLATPVGKYVYDTDQGLDHERIMTTTSDEEREALVRDVVLADERIVEITDGPTVTVSDDGQTVTINVKALTVSGTTITIGT